MVTDKLGSQTMTRMFPLIACLLVVPLHAAAQVEMSGIKAAVKLEEPVSGHLEALNGQYKLRASEVTIEPGGKLGVHHHAGPGIRYVIAGEVTFVQGGKATVYKPGQYFFESGDIAHTAHNAGKAPLRMIFFEILPVSWSGASVIAPKPH